MSDDMVRCSACGTPHGSIEDATVCCEKDKPGVVGRKVKPKPTIEERIGALEWKIDILCKAIVRIDGANAKCQDQADCEGCPATEECAEFDRIEGADE